MKKKKKKTIDWKGIERDFRAGKVSNVQIAGWYGVTEGAIRKRAKAGNWTRMMRADVDTGTFRKLSLPAAVGPTVKTPDEAAMIVRRGKGLVYRMMDELDAATSMVGELEDLILQETADDKDGRRRAGMLKAVDLPERAKVVDTLGRALKTFLDAARLDAKTSDGAGDVVGRPGDNQGDDWDRLLN
jgi:hypothetical protein